MKYSFSQIQTYISCPRKYRYKYIDKIPDQGNDSSPSLVLGSAVHNTLEQLYNRRKSFRDVSLTLMLDEFVEQRAKILAELKNQGGEVIYGTKEQEDDYIRRGKIYITNYYNRYAPFTDHQMIANESFVSFKIAGGDTFSGKVDRIDKEKDYFVIHDYKTNKSLPQDTKHREQLTLYSIAVAQKYQRFYEKIKCRLHYLHFDMIDEREVTVTEQNQVKTSYTAIIEQIGKERFSYNMGNKQTFDPIENPQCVFCAYQSICPVRSHQYMDEEIISTEGRGKKTIKNLIDEYADLTNQYNEADKKRSAIKPYLVDYAARNDLKKLYGNESKISISQSTNYKITDHESCAVILQRLGVYDTVIAIDRFKLRKAIQNETIPLHEIKNVLETSVTQTIRVS